MENAELIVFIREALATQTAEIIANNRTIAIAYLAMGVANHNPERTLRECAIVAMEYYREAKMVAAG